MKTKMRLLALGMKQTDLISLLKEKGINTSYCELNLAINGRADQPKHRRILEGVDEILTEREVNENVNP